MADVKLDEHEVLWEPDERSLTRSALARFWAEAEKRSGQEFTEYETLHRWSVSSRDEFWKLVVEFLDLKSHGEIENVVGPGTDDRSKPELVNVVWFEGMKLCVAENLLQNRSDQTAIASYREDLSLWRSLSFKELYAEVNAVAGYCREVLGLKCGDIVAALMPHISDTIIVMLAVNSLGCVWTACSPDFGTIAVLDRFSQVRPKVLIVTDGYIYKGRKVDVNEKNGEIIDSLPSVEHVIFIPFTGQNHHNPDQNQHKRIEFKELTSYNPKVDLDSAFKRVPSDHPLYIMYSSGTTGKPKSIVQGWGVFVNQIKEHALHMDIGGDSSVFFYTTIGWMMWNWSLVALGRGAKLVVFDGAAVLPKDPTVLFRLAGLEGVTHFGASAGFLTALEAMGADVAGVFRRGGKQLAKKKIRAVMVTGSVSSLANFRFVKSSLGGTVQYVSMSGGSDINSCFALGCPVKKVIAEQLQCIGLGEDVSVFNELGEDVREETGELVCKNAIPAMPLCFWNDDDFKAYSSAYFQRFPGIWTHGDYAEITKENGLIIRGRSDCTLNPGGVRMGSSDFYSVLEDMDEISDCAVVGQSWEGDERILLFVVLKTSAKHVDEALQKKIRSELRGRLSPRHVPAMIIAVTDIPYTFNGKKAEMSVKKLVEGKPIGNITALRNPESIDALSLVRDSWSS